MFRNYQQPPVVSSSTKKAQAPVITLQKQVSQQQELDNSSIDDELSDNESLTNNDRYLSPQAPALVDDQGYLLPQDKQQFLLDDNLKFSIETNRYFDLNKKWNPSVKYDSLQLLKSYMETETEYMIILRIINQEYYSTLKAKHILNDSTLDNIFKSVHVVYRIHENFYKDLDERIHNWQKKPCVFDLFAKYSLDFQVYDEYINTFENSFQCLIDSISKPNNEFAEFLKERNQVVKRTYANAFTTSQSKHNFIDSLDLRSCFIHVLKWPDCCAYFLNYYIKSLRDNSHELADLKKCFDYLSELSKKATGIIADSLRLKALLNLQKRIGTKYNIVTKKRSILKEGSLVCPRKYLGSVDKYYVVLLNDMILITEQSTTNESELKPKYLLDAIGLKAYEDMNALNKKRSAVRLPSGLKAENGFVVYVPCIKKKFRFVARNQQEKEMWFHEFEIIETANKYQVEINRSNLGKVMPKWIPDDLCQYCCKCKSEFTTINRRHHCRACGYIFCSKCSKMQVKLEFDAENKRSRICDICYDFINDSFRCGPPTQEEINRRLAVKE